MTYQLNVRFKIIYVNLTSIKKESISRQDYTIALDEELLRSNIKNETKEEN